MGWRVEVSINIKEKAEKVEMNTALNQLAALIVRSEGGGKGK